MTMVNKKQPIKTEIYQRVFVHWKSTIVGVLAGVGDFFIDIAHGVTDHVASFVDPTSLTWPELRLRLIKASIISAIGALGRFHWHRDPETAQRRSYDAGARPPAGDEK